MSDSTEELRQQLQGTIWRDRDGFRAGADFSPIQIEIIIDLITTKEVAARKEIRDWFTETFVEGGPPWANDSAQFQYEAMMELLDEHLADLSPKKGVNSDAE